jgi:hypothetical protein
MRNDGCIRQPNSAVTGVHAADERNSEATRLGRSLPCRPAALLFACPSTATLGATAAIPIMVIPLGARKQSRNGAKFATTRGCTVCKLGKVWVKKRNSDEAAMSRSSVSDISSDPAGKRAREKMINESQPWARATCTIAAKRSP